MPDIKLKTRIQNKYKTLNEWNEIAAGDFIPLKGEVCYAIDGNMVFQKIGDGLTDFTELEWLLSPSVQSDHAENDEQSFAYIKNRLGYDTLVEVPEDKQLIKDMTKINTITYPKEILHQALPDLAALLPTHINTYLIEQLNMDDGDGISDFNPFKVALNSFVADVNNIFTSEKLSISENQNFILMAAGNPVFINIWIILSETNLPLYPMDYNLDKDYCVFFALSQADNSFYGTFIGDLDIYNADTYSIQLKHIMENSTMPIDSRFLVNAKSDWDEMDSSKTSYIYNKYGNIVTMYADDSLINYKSGFYEGNFTIGTVYADGIELIENNTSYEGWTLQYKDLPLINTKVYLHLGEKKFSYEGCPVFFGQDFFTTKDGNTLIYVGNPYFISKSYYIYRGAADHLQIADQNDNGLPFLFGFDFTKTPSLVKCFMDNSLLDETNKSYNLTIRSYDIAISTKMIPNYLITAKEKEPWIYDEVKQSLMAPTAYEASGIGSVAIGPGAKATANYAIAIGTSAEANGQNSISLGRYNRVSGSEAGALGGFGTATGQCSVCLNDHTNATGVGSLSINGYTTAAGVNSFALGKSTYAKGAQSIAGGDTSVAGTTGSLAIGSNLRSAAEYCYNFGTMDFSGRTTALVSGTSFTITISPIPTASHDLDFITEYSFNGTAGKDWKTDIKSITYKDYPDTDQRIYTIITQANNSTTTTEKTVYYRKPGFIDQESRMAFSCGKGNEIKNSYYASAFGERIKIDSAQSQFAIGRYNLPESNKAFIIGNGVDRDNRSNALTVDWDGNIEATSLILTSPNGTEFKISVDNAGNIITEDKDGNIVNAFSIQPNNNGNNSLVIGGI